MRLRSGETGAEASAARCRNDAEPQRWLSDGNTQDSMIHTAFFDVTASRNRLDFVVAPMLPKGNVRGPSRAAYAGLSE